MIQIHLSWSQIQMIQRCGIQWEFRYVKGIKRPPGFALIIGSATHESIEQNLRHKMEHELPLPLDIVCDIAAESVERRVDNEGVLIAPDETKPIGELTGAAIDMTVNLATTHYKKAAPKINPIAIETPWIIPIKDEWQLKGIIDVETKTGIRDAKTTAKTPASTFALHSEQLTLYALAFWKLYGKMPRSIAVDFLIKKKAPVLVTQRTKRNKEDFQRILDVAQMAYKMICSGIFLPANPNQSYLCSPKYCGFWNECKWIRKGVSK